MPTLPPLHIQIKLGINSYCKACHTPIDRRSERCRRCHLVRVKLKRFPLSKRPKRICIYCGKETSYQSAKGRGRCRACYHEYMRETASRERRSASRPNAGTYYEDRDGNELYAEDDLKGGFKVGSAWGSLRRCWKAFKIANGNSDDELKTRYAKRIRRLQKILNIETSSSLDYELGEDSSSEDTGDSIF